MSQHCIQFVVCILHTHEACTRAAVAHSHASLNEQQCIRNIGINGISVGCSLTMVTTVNDGSRPVPLNILPGLLAGNYFASLALHTT